MKRAPSGAPSRDRQTRTGSAGVLLAEFVDAAARVDDLLLAGIERMAVRADFDLQIMTERGTRNERVPAAAGHSRLFVLRVDAGFHGRGRACSASVGKKGAQCSDEELASQEKIDLVGGAHRF
jgi:hypothetical protein